MFVLDKGGRSALVLSFDIYNMIVLGKRGRLV